MEERYYETLKHIHAILQPRRYVEIGVRRGDSWALTGDHVTSIGIDPAPQLTMKPRGKATLFEGTSDLFFEEVDPKAILGGPIDLSFVDGMHLFEYALRDFTNLERHSSPDSFILVHDCFPISKLTAERTMFSGIWTGDIWKLVLCLKECRPDLAIEVLDTTPSGLAVITNLKPDNHQWTKMQTQAIDRFIQMPYEYLGNRETMRRILNVSETTPEVLHRIFSKSIKPAVVRDSSTKVSHNGPFNYAAIKSSIAEMQDIIDRN